jgi:hypothetical protein
MPSSAGAGTGHATADGGDDGAVVQSPGRARRIHRLQRERMVGGGQVGGEQLRVRSAVLVDQRRGRAAAGEAEEADQDEGGLSSS